MCAAQHADYGLCWRLVQAVGPLAKDPQNMQMALWTRGAIDGTPILGINSKGKVSPFIPGCQVILTQMDGDKNRISNFSYTTVDGTSGMAHNPVQPHTISAGSRTCADCHMNRKTLGLGNGFYSIKDNFPYGPAPVDFELERIVTEAAELGLDTELFDTCFGQQAHAQQIAEDMAEARGRFIDQTAEQEDDRDRDEAEPGSRRPRIDIERSDDGDDFMA